MTTIYNKKLVCSLCGGKNSFAMVGSTSAFGPSDLDLRPPQLARSTMPLWVQRCPECGYCAENIGVENKFANNIISANFYREQLDNTTFPALANSFLCKAMLDKESEQFAECSWSCIFAAWTCDDARKLDLAKSCRHKAVDMFLMAQKHGQQMRKTKPGEDIAILVDLLRRSGQLEQAEKVILSYRGTINEEINTILNYQLGLIKKSDLDRHTFGEITGIQMRFDSEGLRKMLSDI